MQKSSQMNSNYKEIEKGMVAGVLASAIESVGDYYACARLAGTSHIL